MGKINLDRMTNDPSYEHYAYRDRERRRTYRVKISIPWWLIIAVVAFAWVICHG